MADAMPDYEFERLKLERQRKAIAITKLDQEIQRRDLDIEVKELRAALKETEAAAPKPLTGGDQTEQMRRELDIARADLAAHDIRVRIAEIHGTDERYATNIQASAEAIVELDERIQAMKEGSANG